jgi:hypothetical protein
MLILCVYVWVLDHQLMGSAMQKVVCLKHKRAKEYGSASSSKC